MDYQKKLLTEEQIQNIYVAKGDIVSFFNSDGKFCTKDEEGNIQIIENGQETQEILEDINDIIGTQEIITEEEIVSNELLSIL